jgi:hypothetical protein
MLLPVAGKKGEVSDGRKNGRGGDVLLTSFAWLLKNTAVKRSDRSVMNTRKMGNSILRNHRDKSVNKHEI